MTIEYILLMATVIMIALVAVGSRFRSQFQQRLSYVNTAAGRAIGNVKEDVIQTESP